VLPHPVLAQASPSFAINSSSQKLSTTPSLFTITATTSIPISTLAFKLQLPDHILVTDVAGNLVDQIDSSPTLSSESNWIIPFKKVVREGSKTHIEFAAINLAKNGISINSSQPIASFYVKATPATKEANFTFDIKNTALMTKTTIPQNIARVPNPTITLPVQGSSILDQILYFFSQLFK
jgi:hypothetical protein